VQVEVDEAPGPEWDAYVTRSGGACLGHAAAWARVMRNSYAISAYFLRARDGSGETRGLLPLFLFRGLRGGRELISSPFLDAAGVLADSAEAEEALVGEALGLARRIGAGALELRQLAPPPRSTEAPPAAPRVDLVLPLEESEELQWKTLRAKVRNQTRKAEREGLSLASGDPDALRRSFYSVFCVNMRDLGSPVHGSRFFEAIQAEFGESVRFIVTRDGERPVGGLVAIDYAGVVTIPWASTLRSERSRCPNNQIYWEAIRWAIERGARELDFGRSPRDAGTYRFKLGWGARERELSWVRLSPDGEPLALDSAGDSPWMQRLSSLWARLPVSLTARLGPVIRRRLSN
jgi:FemAB-related protein (PEP-CTERM system-associated)